MPEQRPNPRELGLYLTISQVGMEMVGPIVVGWLLDSWLAWSPWAMIVGAILGLTVGVTHLVVLLNRANENNFTKKDPP